MKRKTFIYLLGLLGLSNVAALRMGWAKPGPDPWKTDAGQPWQSADGQPWF
jgi:hypothetical protein